MEGDSLGADAAQKSQGLVEGWRCCGLAGASSPASPGQTPGPSSDTLTCGITATAPKATRPITTESVTYRELSPAQGHGYSYIKVTRIPSSSSLVFSAQPFTERSSDAAHSVRRCLMDFPPLLFFLAFYCSPPSFLLSLSPVPIPGQAWLARGRGCTHEIN